MPKSLAAFNLMEKKDLAELLTRCCGSREWVLHMASARPFASWPEISATADRIWAELNPADWLEAFTHHPMIGDLESLRAKFASTGAWAQSEQGQVQEAEEEVLQGLASGNRAYLEKFGYIFILCATGKSAAEMLALLQARLPNGPTQELPIAAEQQRQITQIRMQKLQADLQGPAT